MILMTRAELEKRLDDDVQAGKMTAEEADAEWLDYMHKDEVWQEF